MLLLQVLSFSLKLVSFQITKNYAHSTQKSVYFQRISGESNDFGKRKQIKNQTFISFHFLEKFEV